MTKKNFDLKKKFELIYNFLIKGSLALVFGVNIFANISF